MRSLNLALLSSLLAAAVEAQVGPTTALPPTGGPLTAGPLQNNTDVLLILDYATYRGYLDQANEVYTFRNIRYAKPPVGNLRWRKPEPPEKVTEVQDRKEPIACSQPPANDVTVVSGGIVGAGSEDCLFLDLTVPKRIWENPDLKVPVLHWIHGGYYTQGSKDERTFHQFAKLSNGNVVSVAANYRIGSYGFLAGSAVEKDGTPNVGLWDQRAALEWVQKYVGTAGGDKNNVTVMGISAGAGSILHHLVAEGGQKDPLFKSVIFQSAGYATVADKGGLDKKYERIEEFAGCKGKGLACLRALDAAGMKRVAEFSNTGNPKGSSGWDPVPDGKFIVNTPTIEIAKGRYWKNVKAIINGYALNEAGGRWFVDQSIDTSAKFDEYAKNGWNGRTGPAITALTERMNKLYPSTETPNSPFKRTQDRVAAYVADAGFNCHHRAIAQAWPKQTWTYQTALWGGTHYMDQFPSFYDPKGKGINQVLTLSSPKNPAPLQAFQSYLVSAIVTGDPNTQRNKDTTIDWPLTSDTGDTMAGVLNFTDPKGPAGFKVISSPRLVKDRCDFWQDVWTTMSSPA